MVIHSDAADVSYGGTLGTDPVAWSPGLVGGSRFMVARGTEKVDNALGTSGRPVATAPLVFVVRIRPSIPRLVDSRGEPGGGICSERVGIGQPVDIAELRKLKTLLDNLRLQLVARWMSSVVNWYFDAHPGT